MKRIILFLLFVPCLLFAQDVNDLRKNAERNNTAESWNILAKYYSEKGVDTTALRKTAEQAYSLALKEKNNKEIGKALIFLSESYFNQGKWEEYIKKNEEALTFSKLSLDADLQRETLINIGYAYNSTGEYDKAISTYNKSINISLRNNRRDSHLATSYINTAFAFLYKGHLDSTIYYVDQAQNTAEIAKDTIVLIESHNQLGILNKRKGNYQKALSHFEKSLQLYELLKDYKKVAALWANIGSLYSDWKKYDKALTIFRKSTRLAYQYSPNDADLIGRSLNNLGLSLVHNSYFSSGLDTLKLALPHLRENKYETYTTYINMAMAYDMLNKEDSCFASIQKAEKILSENKKFPAGRLYLYKGTLFVKKGLYKEAIPILEQYVNLQSDPSKIYSTDIYGAYNNLSKAYELGLKDYKQALLYRNIAYAKQDSLYKIEHNNMMSDFYAQYETAEKELEISRLNEEKQETRFKTSLMLSVGILSILALSFAFLYNRMKRLRKEKEAILLTTKINEKELENQAIRKESELKQMRYYLDGLEVERNRLSKDLHDVVANNLYILDQKLKDIDHIPESIFSRIEDLYNQTRNISHELISPSFQYTTLPEILFNFIEETKDNTDIQFHMHMETEDYFDNLPMSISHEIYRIIQESIGNIIKHSFAQNAWINLSYSDNNIYLEIKDDGEGFDIQKQTKGIGLQIIQNRCNSLNGNLMIDSEIRKGSSIRITIPVILPNADE